MQNIAIGYYKPNIYAKWNSWWECHTPKFCQISFSSRCSLSFSAYRCYLSLVWRIYNHLPGDSYIASHGDSPQNLPPSKPFILLYSRFINRFKSHQTPNGDVQSVDHNGVPYTKGTAQYFLLYDRNMGICVGMYLQGMGSCFSFVFPIGERPYVDCTISVSMNLKFLREYKY